MTTNEPAPADVQEASGDARRARWWKVAAAVAVACAVVSMGTLGFLLVRAGDDEPSSEVRACVENRDFRAGGEPRCPPKGVPFVDGLVQDATATGFDLVTLDGDKRSYAVRPADRPYIDVQHAQTHASLGQPIRIYVQRIDGEQVIVYMTDPPLGDGTPNVHG